MQSRLTVSYWPISKGGVYNPDARVNDYLRRELLMSGAFLRRCGGNAALLVGILRSAGSQLEPPATGDEVREAASAFADAALPLAATFDRNNVTKEDLKAAIDKNVNITENPLWETYEILKNSANPQRCATESTLIVLLLDGKPLASIAALTDPRITLAGEQVCYFIGIRKSLLCICLQHLGLLLEIKVSEYLVAAVVDWATQHNAKVVATTPLASMIDILRKRHGFTFKLNRVRATFTPPNCLITQPEELCAWKHL